MKPNKPTKRHDASHNPAAKRSNVPPARAAALEALERCLGLAAPERRQVRETDAQAALDATLSARPLDPRDAALATELFYGVLRSKTRVEYILSRFLDRPESLPPGVLLILCAASHEMLHLDRVPARASVNWGVDAVREAANDGLAGLANAVLRKVAALAEQPLPEGFFGPETPPEEHPDTLARKYACPDWLVELWLDEYGPETGLRYLQAQALPPALGIAVQHRHPRAAEIAASLAARPGLLGSSGLGLAFAAGTHLDDLPDETLVRQSFAGREALLALDPGSWPDPVWDACSGRGGKTRLLLELGKSVLASDIHRGRIRALQAEQPEVEAVAASALERPPFSTPPRTILLDAPCSGLGTLSRRPDIKWKRSEDDFDDLVELQAAMLENAWKRLPRGGLLAYLTCTLNPDENERQIAAFLAGHPDAELRTEWTTDPDAKWGEFFYAALLAK
ncbi:transcription antitermination factor NusB [Paucidesulfovibrio longus]|uniref:transcription antitermination factor NusB n=1 Tax=Paucidesulfovibrio longus TaxID=889 RepID=UPI0009DC4533|nr:transcription antitermination factor NusB [Paucidesulfovibrio longus]